MRLLNTATFQVEFFPDDEIKPYAILSHRWQNEEVTFEEMKTGNATTNKGYQKVKNCCAVAEAQGLEYVWIDTLCIDKRSSAELSEAINSMYRWYQKAEVCYAYLADVSSVYKLSDSEWFGRGWTLQELIAPPIVHFYNMDWQDIGTKQSLANLLSKATGISLEIILGEDNIGTASVAQRMSWAAERKTTRVEDRAYSLLGIFGINMPLLYGEGSRAFTRLQEEILKVSDDDSIFAWHSTQETQGVILATSPDAFKDSVDVTFTETSRHTSGPLTISNKGIHMDVRFIGLCSPGIGLAVLRCESAEKKNSVFVICLRDLYLTMEYFERVECHVLGLLNLQDVKPSLYPTRKICIKNRQLRPERITKVAKVALQSNRTWVYQPADELRINQFGHDFQDTVNSFLRDLLTQVNKGDEGKPVLLDSSESGNVHRVWLLLTRSDIRLNQADDLGRTALSYAASIGSDAIVTILLSHVGIHINIKDHGGMTPLSYAIIEGHETVARILLETGEVDLTSSDQDGRTALSLSVIHEREDIARLLLTYDADMETQDKAGQTPLLTAIERGLEPIVRLFVRYNARLEVISADGRSALMQAAKAGHRRLCELLLDEGAFVDQRDQAGKTSLAYATEKGFDSIVILLLDQGADLEERSLNGETSLFAAVKYGHQSIVRLLLDRGANLLLPDRRGRTVLSWSIVQGDFNIVRLLLDSGAETEMKDQSGETALSLAAQQSKVAIARLLIERGATIDVVNNSGDTPLLWTSITGNAEMAELMLTHGADPNHIGRSDQSPLWRAVQGEHHEVAELLLEYGVNQSEKDAMLGDSSKKGDKTLVLSLLKHGASINYRDNYGSALSKAVDKRQDEIVKLLVDCGADIEAVGPYRKGEVLRILES